MKSYKFYIFLTILFLILNLFPTAMASTQKVRLIIFPFQNLTQNKDDNWIGNGFSETLTASLASIKEFTVLERSQLKNVLTEQMFGATAYADQKTAAETGKLLSANFVVIGSFQKINDQIRIISRFVDVTTGQVEQKHVVDMQGKMDDLFSLQNQLSEKTIQSFEIKIAKQRGPQLKNAVNNTTSVIAYEQYIKGKEFLDQMSPGAYYKAIEWLEKSINTDPYYAIAYAGLSLACTHVYELYGNKDNDQYDKKALNYAKKAIELAPDLSEAHKAMAYAYAVNDKKNDALQEIQIALKLSPNDIDAIIIYFNKIEKTDLEKYVNELEKYTSVEKDNPLLLLNLGSAYASKAFMQFSNSPEQGKEDENALRAISYFEQVLKKYPQNYVVHIKLAEIYSFAKKNDLADYHIKQAFLIEPASFYLYFDVALVYYNNLRWQESETMLQKAIEIKPAADAYQTLGIIHFEQSKYEAALENFANAIKYAPDEGISYYYSGLIYMERNEKDKAKSILTEGLKCRHNLSYIYHALGIFYDKQNNLEEAIKNYYLSLTEIEKDEKNHNGFISKIFKSDIYYEIAASYVALNKLDPALDALLKAKELYPKDKIYAGLADIYINKGLYKDAIPNLEKITEMNKNNPNALYNLGNVLLRIKQLDKAEQFFQKAIELKPDFVKAHYSLGSVYWQLGKYKEAADSWETTLKLDPANQNAKEWLQKAKDKIK